MFLDPIAYGKAAAVRVLFIYLITAPLYLLFTDCSVKKIFGLIVGFFVISLAVYFSTFVWYWFFAKLYNKFTKQNLNDFQE